MAREFAARGCSLVLSGRNQQGLESLAGELGGEVLLADLTDAADVLRVADRAATVDILICNAGTGGDVKLPNETVEHIDQLIDVNLRAPLVLTTRFAQDKLAAGQRAHVVLIGSLSGLAPTPDTRLYNGTKFGLRGFGLSLAQDLDGTCVGVSLVEPGFIREAGMFAEGGVALPKAVRTKSPHDVALGVVAAIEKNRAEVFVSPVELRASATFATVAPTISAWVQKRLGVADMKGV